MSLQSGHSRMVRARRIGHLVFETADIARAVDYYTQVVGLVPVSASSDRAFLSTKLGQLAVELQHGPTPRCVKVTFEIGRSCELVDVQKQLSAHGLQSEQRNDMAPGIARAVSFKDPKGTEIELFPEWECATTPQQVLGVGPLKFGHVAFTHRDPKSIARFYEEVLGFRVSDWIEDFFVFLRCNSDHHSINFIRGDSIHMHHYAFELKDFAEIQGACELLAQFNKPIIWGPVRLGPGHNVAVFHQHPDGHVTEFYAELDRMVDEELGYFEPRPWHCDRPQRPKVWSRNDRSIWGPPPTEAFPRNFG
jgi:catechol 2,3-dioxygenase-like lactoylglutathione lyase family enzyme